MKNDLSPRDEEEETTSPEHYDTQPTPRKNIWNLVLGIAFIGYGSYRVYTLSNDIEANVLGFVLGIGFIGFGIYDLWKYNKGI